MTNTRFTVKYGGGDIARFSCRQHAIYFARAASRLESVYNGRMTSSEVYTREKGTGVLVVQFIDGKASPEFAREYD